ncbi:MAG: hypothetical protein LKJ44_08085 [Bifidobacteriaceae bacterium]|jgi:hypothetical protein|nr:hypothetical protein [Bifidobacteriaceae bacterium]MCI1979643.1 hypothetical protein [Bifidobacteriaceae bacterium]
MTVLTTSKYLLPYPADSEPIKNLPTILETQAKGIETALSKFDFDGSDTSTLTARVASLETLLSQLKNNVVVLFDNDNQPFSGAVSLTETAANFEKLTICFRTNDDLYGSMDVAKPNNKKIILSNITFIAEGNIYVKSRTYVITDKTINTYKSSTNYQSGEVNVTLGQAGRQKDVIAITQVYGTRKMSIV